MKRVIIAGNREFNDYDMLRRCVDTILHDDFAAHTPLEFVSGHAHGADELGEKYFHKQINGTGDYKLTLFPADWGKYGRSAGPIRNREMVNYAGDDGVLIAFWDGTSPGTRNVINEAIEHGLEVHVYRWKRG